MSPKTKRTYMIHEEQNEWITKKANEFGVDKSFLVRRAIQFYMKNGIKRDKFLRQYSGKE